MSHARGSAYTIYLTGPSGVGKYTIAKAIVSLLPGAFLCDNQLINNPIFELVGYDGTADFSIPHKAWEAIGQIRSAVFEYLETCGSGHLILTNCLYDDPGDRALFNRVLELAHTRRSIFVPVRLHLNGDLHRQRIAQPARSLRWKSIDPRDCDAQCPQLSLFHTNALEIHVDSLSPESAAQAILAHAANCL